jgi:hypothetical protein
MSACTCATVGPESELRFHDCHHVYKRGDRELPSVSSVIRAVWPPSYSGVSDAVLENARERGVEVDAMFSAWVNGGFGEIDVTGYRNDAVALTKKLINWWVDANMPMTADVRCQVQCDDGEIAGTADIVTLDAVYDLKTVYSLLPTYPIQLGGYVSLIRDGVLLASDKAAIIHVTERFKEPKLIEYDVPSILRDWATTRDFYNLTRR